MDLSLDFVALWCAMDYPEEILGNCDPILGNYDALNLRIWPEVLDIKKVSQILVNGD